MSAVFPDREKAFEDKWAHDEELRFKGLARRNRYLGQWAAGEMGLTGSKKDAYVAAVIAAELEREGDEAVFRKLRSDFAAAKIARTDHLIRRKMDEFLAFAKAEIRGEG